MEKLEVKNLTFSYPDCDAPVLKNISFSVNAGDFVVLAGPTGSGKSTLLKLLKKEVAPLGRREGSVCLDGQPVVFDDDSPETENRKTSEINGKQSWSENKEKCFAGFVTQNPKEQIVTDKVWHELAFGLENMNMPQDKMALKVAEMASYFGIESWYEKNVNELSGGQMQLLNLAAVMVMDPDVLILDEPSAQLDPIAASEFFSTLRKLNEDFAMTIIIAEHRLEELIPVCDKVMIMKDGGLREYGEPGKVLKSLSTADEIFEALPAAYRLFRMIDEENKNEGILSEKEAGKTPFVNYSMEYNGEQALNEQNRKEDNYSVFGMCPLSISEGRRLIRDMKSRINLSAAGSLAKTEQSLTSGQPDVKETALEMKDVCFRFSKESKDVLKDLNLNIYAGELFCILGGNGSGKTTALNVAAGLLKPYSGSVKVFGKKLKEYKNQSLYNKCLSMLPQDVQTVFLYNTVREELGFKNVRKSERASSFIDESLKECIQTSVDATTGASPMCKHASDLKRNMEVERLAGFPYDLTLLMDKHPYDLSGGEQQILALAKAYLTEPRLLLLDEPTKGLDAYRKQQFIEMLKNLKSQGITIVVVTHDVEFAAKCADRCALFFKGTSVSCSETYEFFSGNSFYTTSAVRMTKGICRPFITVESLAKLL